MNSASSSALGSVPDMPTSATSRGSDGWFMRCSGTWPRSGSAMLCTSSMSSTGTRSMKAGFLFIWMSTTS